MLRNPAKSRAANEARLAQMMRSVAKLRLCVLRNPAKSFDDTVGGVSGTWVLDRPPSTTPGLMVHIMVADADRTIAAIEAAGGSIVQPIDPASGEVFAHFRDPAGNVLGIYQQRGLAETEARLAAASMTGG